MDDGRDDYPSSGNPKLNTKTLVGDRVALAIVFGLIALFTYLY
jgi:hypothetical protein